MNFELEPKIDTKVINDNLIIWRALNMIDKQRYDEPINQGRGISDSPPRNGFGYAATFTYFHNSWSYLMEAILVINGKAIITSFESAYNELLEKCKELTKDLPQTAWYLESSNGKWITRNYKDSYDKDKAVEEIPKI